EDIDHINAHGFGTQDSDIREARGLQEVFGQAATPVPVLGLKGYIDSLGAASGVTELAASVLAAHHGSRPPTLNCEDPDPACPIPVIAGSSQPMKRPYFVKLSFTDLGQCAAVVCRKWEKSH